MRLGGFVIALIALLPGPAQLRASEPLILIEEAHIVPGTEQNARAFLVINNRSALSITLTEVASPLVEQALLVRSTGTPLPRGASVPAHAELYMQPGTVHIALSGVSADLSLGQTLPLTLTLDDGSSASVAARVIVDEADLPDHHDYKHLPN